MAEFPYTTVPGKISEFLKKIHTAGIPDKATTQWLKSVGFTSSNDISLLSVFKFINFCDQAGIPTDRWRLFRGHESKAVLGSAIQQGYSELFEVYPDANTRSDDELNSFFKTRSNVGNQAISKTLSTFKNLCREAEFEMVPTTPPTAAATTSNSTLPPTSSTAVSSQSPIPEVHIDIQIHISAEASAEQIDQMFASIAKHLYGRDAS